MQQPKWQVIWPKSKEVVVCPVRSMDNERASYLNRELLISLFLWTESNSTHQPFQSYVVVCWAPDQASRDTVHHILWRSSSQTSSSGTPTYTVKKTHKKTRVMEVLFRSFLATPREKRGTRLTLHIKISILEVLSKVLDNVISVILAPGTPKYCLFSLVESIILHLTWICQLPFCRNMRGV